MSTRLTLASIAALAAAGLVRRRGQRNEGSRLDALRNLLESSPELFSERYDKNGRHMQMVHKVLVDQYGFDLVGQGGSRIVLGVAPGLVAKVANDPDGIQQNVREYETWSTAEGDGFGHRLVPVVDLFSGGTDDQVLLMEWADPCQDSDPRCEVAWDEAKDDLMTYFWVHDAEYLFNWGWHDGTLKLLDYGND